MSAGPLLAVAGLRVVFAGDRGTLTEAVAGISFSLRMAVTAGKAWKAVSECAPNEDPELADIRAYEKKAGINP